APVNVGNLRLIGGSLKVSGQNVFVSLRKTDHPAQFLLALFESGGDGKWLVGIEQIQLQIQRVRIEHAARLQALDGFDRFAAKIVTVLCLHGKWLAVLLNDPSTGGVTRRFAILKAKDDLSRILLRLHAEAALVRKKIVVVEDRRRPAIPRLIVVSKGIQKLFGSYMALTHLAGDVTGRAKIFGKDNIVRAQLRFKPF